MCFSFKVRMQVYGQRSTAFTSELQSLFYKGTGKKAEIHKKGISEKIFPKKRLRMEPFLVAG